MTTVNNVSADSAVVRDLAVAAVAPHELLPGLRAFVLPDNSRVHLVDTEEFEGAPRRPAGRTLTVRDEASLIALCAELGTRVRVYADPVARVLTAVLNDDVDGSTPGWRDLRVTLGLVHTVEWKRWTDHDGKLLPQREFAEHIEECLSDIVEPVGADMLEIAQTLEATTRANFRSSVRLTDGQRQFLYNEDTSASAGQSGELVIPETFVLALRPWKGRGGRFRVEARLRYRVTDEGLRLGYRLIDIDKILDAAFQEILDEITAHELDVIIGTA